MEIEIEKIEQVIERNKRKLDELDIGNQVQGTTKEYEKLHNLFNCFIGDLYKLFGEECLRKAGGNREDIRKVYKV